MTPRVRFAPSPTGYLHIGGARTALFNWLYARKNGGTFVLRMEDTDQERSTPESVEAILKGLKWLGIDWDEGPEVGGPYAPYFQTQRLKRYREISDQLIAAGKAYYCTCTAEDLKARRAAARELTGGYKYEGTCRGKSARPAGPHVVRFHMPDGDAPVSFTDEVLGTITKTMSDLDDFVMMRGDGIPLYNFGCVVDDYDMKISHVGRGQEHVNSTFPQLMVYAALGWATPKFAHFPLILGPDREKLSKRKHPEADVMLHANNGVLPEALLNFVVRLGWSHGDEETISVAQMKDWFDFAQVGKTSGVWNPEKLSWLSQHYLKTLPPEVVAQRALRFFHEAGISEAKADAKLARIVSVLRDRSKTLKEMAAAGKYFYGHGVVFDEKARAKHLTPEGKTALAETLTALTTLPSWTPESIEPVVKAVSEKLQVGMGKVAQPLRVAVTGGAASPGIGDTLEIIGREESLTRIGAALA